MEQSKEDLQTRYMELSNKRTQALVLMGQDGPENDPEQQAEIEKMSAELDEVVKRLRAAS